MKRTLFVLALLALLLVSACGTVGPKAIIDGHLHDWLYSVEPRANGTVSVWFRYDDAGVYCTSDATLIAELNIILKTANPEVYVNYKSINRGDPEHPADIDLFSQTGCGDTSTATVYRLISVIPIEEIQQ